MKNIFARFQDYVKKPKRNVFDLTSRNNLSLKFGQLTPVLCKEVLPGDSFKIHSKFGLELMPMKFPVQTPMKAYLHYFYVRNRTLWKDWMDFIGGTKDGLVMPYVQPVDKQKFYRVGGLADYLGVPNVVYSGTGSAGGESVGSRITLPYRSLDGFVQSFDGTSLNGNAINYNKWFTSQQILNYSHAYWWSYDKFVQMLTDSSSINSVVDSYAESLSDIVGKILTQFLWNIPTNVQQQQQQLNEILAYENPSAVSTASRHVLPPTIVSHLSLDGLDIEQISSYIGNLKAVLTSPNSLEYPEDYNNYGLYLFYTDADNRLLKVSGISGKLNISTGLFTSNLPFYLIPSDIKDSVKNIYVVCIPPSNFEDDSQTITVDMRFLTGGVDAYFEYSEQSAFTPVAIGVGNYSNTPYDSQIRLNALPFRAYEAIYNAYYRNAQNDPFMLNGVAEYNRYITNNEGGADNTQYDLFNRNWEYDFLTSAVQSPQQGIAPLVGISMTGEATFADENGNTYYAQAIMDNDGNITGWQSHSSDMPVGSLRLLMDMANTGISINDLRNVNSYQRFLENNIRRGLKYRDQIMSHFGVKVRYDELDMPEFIGGVSASFDINKVSQTAEGGSTPMGSFVGQGNLLAESKHDITHYCDEHGYIIGILSIVPIPVYSQLLPKHFTKTAQLDYFFPEFGHIGYQPIEQMLVSPLQTFYNGGDLHKVFGYNRAWYDYLDSVDEVHGQFRTTMRDFIMNRTFESEPVLNGEFLKVDADDVNDVFSAGTDDDIYKPEADKILGSMLFEITAKRPIPLFGIPKLTE